MVAVAAAAFFTTAGAAQQSAAEGSAKSKGACKQDVEKLCKDVKPGEGRMLSCLKEHQKEVSPKCAGHLKQVQQGMKQLSAACEPDVEKYCFDAPIGKGGMASCLKKHSADLSPDCKAAVAKGKAAKSSAKPQQ
jgi:hypothetical protein